MSPAAPSQCSNQTVSWNVTLYQEPPEIRVFIPGDNVLDLDRPTSNNSTQQSWGMRMTEGTQVVLLVQPVASSRGDDLSRTSPLITVTSKSDQGDTCLPTNEQNSMVTSTSTTPSSTTIESTAATSTLPPPITTLSAPATMQPRYILLSRKRASVVTDALPVQRLCDSWWCCRWAWFHSNCLGCNRPLPIVNVDTRRRNISF